MKIILPLESQINACIRFPKFRKAYCTSPKSLWGFAPIHKGNEQLFRLAGPLAPHDPESLAYLPKLVPCTDYGSGEVFFSPLYSYYRTSPQWKKDRWHLMQRTPGEWLVEQYGKFPRTCAEADPKKKYPDIEWNDSLVKLLLEKVPTISSEEHPVWQEHLKTQSQLAAARAATRRGWPLRPTFGDFDPEVDDEVKLPTREESRRRWSRIMDPYRRS